MSSSEELYAAILFSYESMTWITWLVIAFGLMKSIQAFIKAHADNNSYAEMKKNKDRTGITQFYYGIIMSVSCIIVFFLPYFFYFEK